jgi:hypothetical protein
VKYKPRVPLSTRLQRVDNRVPILKYFMTIWEKF